MASNEACSFERKQNLLLLWSGQANGANFSPNHTLVPMALKESQIGCICRGDENSWWAKQISSYIHKKMTEMISWDAN